jgi:signal transduction histidine kinase
MTPRNHDRVLRVIHDIRGGALTSLTLYLQMAERGDLLARDIPQMVLLANDHAKILRSMIVDLDRIRYTLDELFVPQPIDVIPATWHAKHYRIPSGHTAWVTVECPLQGYIAESVIELAALERVLYNLVNNAVRHCAQPHVGIRITPSSVFADMLDIEVWNTIDDAQYQRLRALCPDAHWDRLIRESLSTTGSGLGLGICADIVAHVCGMDDVAHVLATDSFRVSVTPESFHVHCVWPLVDLVM